MEACDAEARGTSTAPWPPVTAHLWPPPVLPPALAGPLQRGTRGGARGRSSRPTAGSLLAPWAFVWPTHHQVPPARTFNKLVVWIVAIVVRKREGGHSQV